MRWFSGAVGERQHEPPIAELMKKISTPVKLPKRPADPVKVPKN